MTCTPIDLRICADIDDMSRAAADFILEITSAVSSRDRFTAALSGGSTPEKLYALLASRPYRDAMPWQRLHFFWVDERCVPPDERASNFRAAQELFLSKVAIPAQNVHRIRGEEGPVSAARQYDREIRGIFGSDELPRFELVLLGVGEDGHTASLFPGQASLQEEKAISIPVFIEPPGLSRVTLSLPVLNNAAAVLFLVSGSRKSRIIREILEEGKQDRYPAGQVRPQQGRLTWIIDREAASTLERVPG